MVCPVWIDGTFYKQQVSESSEHAILLFYCYPIIYIMCWWVVTDSLINTDSAGGICDDVTPYPRPSFVVLPLLLYPRLLVWTLYWCTFCPSCPTWPLATCPLVIIKCFFPFSMHFSSPTVIPDTELPMCVTLRITWCATQQFYSSDAIGSRRIHLTLLESQAVAGPG